MSTILSVGDIYLESQFFVKNIPQENEFTFSEHATTIVGSKIINASRIMQKAGNQVTYCGKVGNDDQSQIALSILKAWGFKTAVQMSGELPIGKIVVVTPQSGKSAIILLKGANATLSMLDIGSVLTDNHAFQAVYTGTNLELSPLYSMVEKCKKLDLPIFLDIPNQQQELDLEKLSTVDFFMPNRQEAELVLGSTIDSLEAAKDVILQLRKVLTGNILITLDKDGCLLLERGKSQPIHFQTKQITSVDETGAGDIFRGVFVHALLSSKNIEHSVSVALEKATASVLERGVDASIKATNF